MEQARQSTLLCEFSDDKSQYASFLQKGDPYSSYVSQNEATLPRDGGKNHMTSFQQCPCDVLDSDGPDVIYSPRIPRGDSTSGSECYSPRSPKDASGSEPISPRTLGDSTNRDFYSARSPKHVSLRELYSPRILKDASGRECEACRTSPAPVPMEFFGQKFTGAPPAPPPPPSQSGKTLGRYKPPLQPVPEFEDFRNNMENNIKEQQGVENIVSVWCMDESLFFIKH